MLVRRFTSACLVLAASSLIFAGCEAEVSTGGNDINTDTVEKEITTQYPKEADGLTIETIDCESGEAEVGTKIICSASNSNDVELEITAEVTKVVDDENVDIHWEVTKATAAGATFGEVAAQTLAQTRAVDTVECPDGIVIEKGTVVNCVGTMDDGSKREVKLTLTDGDGAFDIDLLGPVDG